MSLENHPSFLLDFSVSEMSIEEKHFYEFGSFRLDIAERQLSNDGVPVSLTPKAFDVLAALVERGGHLVEKDELLRLVWSDSFVEEANVARIVHTLRKVLSEDKNGNKFIETVPKRGYRFVAICDKENGFADFFDAPGDTAIAAMQSKDSSAIEKDFAVKAELTKSFPTEEKSEKRAWLWAISAAASIGLLTIAAGFWFNFSGAKSGNALSFEGMTQTRLTQSGDVYTPTVSPDGRYLAYINPAGASRRGLRLRQITTGSVLELVPPRSNVNFWALKFSPDSNYLYYVEDDGGNTGFLYRIASLGGQPQKILDFVNGGLTVSPDGTRLAFKRMNKPQGVTSIIVAGVDGSNEQTIATINAESNYWSLDWSPDGSTIAYVINRHEAENNSWYVAEIPAAGGAERRIGEPRASQIINARWLPDRKGLIVNAVDAKTKLPQIYYRSYPDGAERRVTNDLNDYTGLSVTLDGKSIVSQRSEQNRHIWLTTDDQRQARQLTFKNGQHFDQVSWLSDDTLVFDADENGSFDDYNIWRLKIGESEPQPLTTGAGNNTSPTAAPDGKTIAFVSSRSGKPQIWRMNADGSQPTQITDADFGVYQLQFSPDGQTLYFKTSIGGKGQLMRVSTGGGAAVSIVDSDIHRWAISPDGEKLAYSSLDPDTQKVVTRIRPIDRDQTEKVFGIEPETYLQWAKDGQALYFTLAADNSENIWRQSLSEVEPHRLTDFDEEKVFRFASSPDGKNVACIRYTISFDAVLLKFDE